MTNLTISLALAYVLSGISQVTADLTADPISKPMWAMRPTFGKMMFVGAAWFARPFIEATHSQQVARGIAFAIPKVVLPFATLLVFVWLCIIAAEYWFENLALRTVAVAVLLIVGGRFVMPLVNLLTVPLSILIALPLDWLFPLKEGDAPKNVRWCKNCVHHKQAATYEDVIGGSWRADAMPHVRDLPCDIAGDALDVWQGYFRLELNKRALYPKDCPHFMPR